MTINPKPDTKDPIDVVISWVDGNDPGLAAKRAGYLKGNHGDLHPGAHPTRFASVNEIRYCVLSILRFAPFIRKIFIVTDGQDPNLYEDIQSHFPERVGALRIVDHREIFAGFEQYLPSFNSISIGHMIWRIRGLSDRFVYFNDDTFLIRSIEPKDWFMSNEPVIRGKWTVAPFHKIVWNELRRFYYHTVRNKLNYEPRASFNLGQWNSAAILGFKTSYFTNSHTPHTVDRKIAEEFFHKNRSLIEKNISYRFRNHTQFTFISLCNHLQLLRGNRNIASPDLAYLQPYNRSEKYVEKKIRYCESNQNLKYICVQSLEMCRREDQQKIFQWMEEIMQLKQPD
jgi:hypothetical protein